MNKFKKKLLAGLSIILIWWLASLIVGNKLILPGPFDSIRRMLYLFKSGIAVKAILISSFRIFLGLSLSIILGMILACLVYRLKIEDYFEPAISLIRATPVVSFVLLVLFWTNPQTLVIVIVLTVSLPIFYESCLNGLYKQDKKLRELAEVFGLSKSKTFLYVSLEPIIESLTSAMIIGLGLGYKSGISAEVIAGAQGGIGDGLYSAKLVFESVEIFAWTMIVIIISGLLESGLKVLRKKIR